MLKYTIITKNQVYDGGDDETRIKEQLEKMKILGIYDDYEHDYLCHFFDSPWINETTIATRIGEAIQYLAIKDGVDLVQYENGNYGFVAYYSGEPNGFEIIG